MQYQSTLEHICAAHIRTGAPGRVVGYFADGRYLVQLQYGQRYFRFKTRADGRVTVRCNWDYNRKQATA